MKKPELKVGAPHNITTLPVDQNKTDFSESFANMASSALRALALEYKSIESEPVEGFRVKLVNDDSLFEWEVAIFGPPDTLYQGGYFKVSAGLQREPPFHYIYTYVHI